MAQGFYSPYTLVYTYQKAEVRACSTPRPQTIGECKHYQEKGLLVLRNRSFLPGSPQQRMMIWLGLLLLCLIIAAGALLYLILYKTCPTCDPREIAVSAWERLLKEKGMVFALVATPVLLVYFIILAFGSRNRERLILSETGIEFRSPMPGPLNFMHRDWSLQWLEVRRAWIGPMFKFAGGQFTSLFFETGNKRRRILLYPWVDPRHYHPRKLRKEKAHIDALQKQQGPEYEALTTESAVVRYIAEHVHGIEIEPAPTESTGFALERNPWALCVVVLFFPLVAYTVIDGFVLIGETYVTRPAYEVFSALGLLAAIVAARLLRARGVPNLESAVLGVLLGAAIGCALYPGALRINQWTDSSGLHVHTYRSQGQGRFTPLDESLPELHFDDYPEYWRGIGVGEHQDFELRRGGLGFHQLNMAPIHDAIVKNSIRAGIDGSSPKSSMVQKHAATLAGRAMSRSKKTWSFRWPKKMSTGATIESSAHWPIRAIPCRTRRWETSCVEAAFHQPRARI